VSGDPSVGARELTPSDAEYWNEIYRGDGGGWELGRATPPLARWFAAHPAAGKRALVVGCGRGHEARLLARGGARVVAIDIASEAITAARALTTPDDAAAAAGAGGSVEFRELDLFALPKTGEVFDLIVEHTCFCAIEVARRGEYVSAVAGALPASGELVALFYAHGRPGGPPFTTDDAEVRRLFAPRFELAHYETPPDSIERRAGLERLARLVRKA
jgi:SAM-dependent methyltransferase